MAQIKTAQTARQDMKRTFIGAGWVNKVKAGDRAGTEFISVKFDKGVELNGITPECQIQLWPNTLPKREGKRDADFRVSILTPNVTEAQA